MPVLDGNILMNDEVLGVKWLHNLVCCIGVVAQKFPDGYRVYISPIVGNNESRDIKIIVALGTYLTEKQARGFFDFPELKYLEKE